MDRSARLVERNAHVVSSIGAAGPGCRPPRGPGRWRPDGRHARRCRGQPGRGHQLEEDLEEEPQAARAEELLHQGADQGEVPAEGVLRARRLGLHQGRERREVQRRRVRLHQGRERREVPPEAGTDPGAVRRHRHRGAPGTGSATTSRSASPCQPRRRSTTSTTGPRRPLPVRHLSRSRRSPGNLCLYERAGRQRLEASSTRRRGAGASVFGATTLYVSAAAAGDTFVYGSWAVRPARDRRRHSTGPRRRQPGSGAACPEVERNGRRAGGSGDRSAVRGRAPGVYARG